MPLRISVPNSPIDRLFLDANLWFSAAYQVNSGLLKFWKLRDVTLCTSRYAEEAARMNLDSAEQKQRLMRLMNKLQIYEGAAQEVTAGVCLPDKDRPIMLAAIAAAATHLITGDLRDFGQYFGKSIGRFWS